MMFWFDFINVFFFDSCYNGLGLCFYFLWLGLGFAFNRNDQWSRVWWNPLSWVVTIPSKLGECHTVRRRCVSTGFNDCRLWSQLAFFLLHEKMRRFAQSLQEDKQVQGTGLLPQFVQDCPSLMTIRSLSLFAFLTFPFPFPSQSIEPFALFYLPVTLKLISRYLLPDLARVDPIHLDQPPPFAFQTFAFLRSKSQ